MPRMVKCAKLGQELPGVIYKPFQNELGQRIYDNISQRAWQMWVEQSKMLVNEYRLDLTSAQGQKLLLEQAEKFFFGEGADRPSEYVDPAEAGHAHAHGHDHDHDHDHGHGHGGHGHGGHGHG